MKCHSLKNVNNIITITTITATTVAIMLNGLNYKRMLKSEQAELKTRGKCM